MTEQVLLTHDSAVRIGLGSDAVDAAQVEDPMRAAREIVVVPAGAVALPGTRLRGGRNDIVVETMHFRKRRQSDETSAAIGAYLSRKV